MRCLEIKRQLGTGEIAEVNDLLEAAARADGRRPLSDHLYLDLVHGGHDGFAAFVAREPGHGHPVAYAQVSRGNDSHAFELVIHPHHRYEMATIGPELIELALDVVGSDGGGEVNWWVFEPTTMHEKLAADVGLMRSRTLYQMRRPLPAERHATVETRAFRPGDDDEAWLRVNNRAFAEHREQGGWTIDTFCARQGEPWFDAEGFRVYERDGQMAAFCWTKIHPAAGDDPVLGEIYVIAVDPDFHGHGLGSELTLAGLDHLASVGVGTAMLYVDAANETAVAMYERLGFSVYCTNAAFEAEIAASEAPIPDHRGPC